jgi:hypothetical protein
MVISKGIGLAVMRTQRAVMDELVAASFAVDRIALVSFETGRVSA